MLWKSSVLLWSAFTITGCISATHADRGTAFTACKSENTQNISHCVEQKMADRRRDREDMASTYQSELNACEDRRTEAAARGAGADAISCSANLADYALQNAGD
jgi:hypothetical protein